MAENRFDRKYIRFPPDANAYAQIDKDADRNEFLFEYAGLVLEESPLGGCGLVVHEMVGLTVGDVLRVKVGQLAPLKARVVWAKPLGDQVIRVGMKFLQ